MKYLESIFSDQIIEAIGWSIFHSIWQAALLLIILVIALFLMKEFSARTRYFMAYATLVLMLAWSISTGIQSYKYAQEKLVIKERLLTNPQGITQEIKEILTVENNASLKKATKAQLKWIKFKSTIQNNFQLVFVLWLIGILFFLFKMAGGMAYLMRLSKRQTIPLDANWIVKMENLAIALSINKPIQILQSYIATVPMIIGHLKPIILIPVSLFTGLSDKEIEAIIAHELAHIKRHDYFFNIIQAVIETLFFFHPAVWVISKIIRDEREHSCDKLAVIATGDKLNYIKALASAQELTFKNPYKAVAFTRSNGGLLTRVKRLKTMSKMKNKVSEGFFAASLIFISLILLSFTTTDNNKNNTLKNLSVYTSENPLPVLGSLTPTLPILSKDTIERNIRKRMENMEEVPDDLEKVIEVALAENEEMSTEILKSIEEAMKEIEWAKINEEAMREVKIEMETLNLDSIINEAMKEAELEIAKELDSLKEIDFEGLENEMISEKEALQIAKEAMELTRETMKAIDMESIVSISINESMKALEELNIGEIINDALKGVDWGVTSDSVAESKKIEALEKELDKLENQK
ncbi:MAG: M48 family metalloprotease [Salinivirgaceae bacterium]|nr:M48 family metalloprotease [Salinivirgaceae bacterium]